MDFLYWHKAWCFTTDTKTRTTTSHISRTPPLSSMEANTDVIHSQKQKTLNVASVLLFRHILNTKSCLEYCFSLKYCYYCFSLTGHCMR